MGYSVSYHDTNINTLKSFFPIASACRITVGGDRDKDVSLFRKSYIVRLCEACSLAVLLYCFQQFYLKRSAGFNKIIVQQMNHGETNTEKTQRSSFCRFILKFSNFQITTLYFTPLLVFK